MSSTFKWKIAQKLELKWWKNYLNNKNVAEYLNWKKQYWTNFLIEIKASVNVNEQDSVLDIGCGPAGIFSVLNTSIIYGVDPLLESYQTNLEHFNSSMYPNVTFKTASIEAFDAPFLFDKVFCLNAINHVSDIEKSYDKLFSFVKPGGQLIISIDSHKYSFLKHLFRLIPGDALHPHQYDLKEYRNFITKRNGVIEQEVISKPGNIFDYWIMVVRKTC